MSNKASNIVRSLAVTIGLIGLSVSAGLASPCSPCTSGILLTTELIAPETVSIGETVFFLAKVKNIAIDAGESQRATFFIDGYEVATYDLTLKRNETVYLFASAIFLVPGTFEIEIVTGTDSLKKQLVVQEVAETRPL